MNRIELLPSQGKFYKANLHAHTTLSDGKWTPEELKRNYKAQGYSIVAYTDHNRYAFHQELCDEAFVALAAFEANIDDAGEEAGWNTRPVYHLNFYDTMPLGRAPESVPLPERRYRELDYINGYIRRMNELGFLCCYNHPWWSMQTYDDYKGLQGLTAMEIYNHGCEHDGLYGYAPQAYDELLRAGQRIGCFSTDDNHDEFPIGNPLNDSFGGFTMLKLAQLDYPSVIAALQKGQYYASMGPELHEIYIEGDTLVVECSPVEKIYVMTEGRNGYKKLASPGETITRAEFQITGNEGYLRADCRDARGLHANSPAYFLDGRPE